MTAKKVDETGHSKLSGYSKLNKHLDLILTELDSKSTLQNSELVNSLGEEESEKGRDSTARERKEEDRMGSFEKYARERDALRNLDDQDPSHETSKEYSPDVKSDPVSRKINCKRNL